MSSPSLSNVSPSLQSGLEITHNVVSTFFSTTFLLLLVVRIVHAVAQSQQHDLVQVEPVLAEGFTSHYTSEPASENGPCDVIRDRGKMHAHCYSDDATLKARATIENLKLCVADAHGNLAVQNM